MHQNILIIPKKMLTQLMIFITVQINIVYGILKVKSRIKKYYLLALAHQHLPIV